MEDGIGTMHCLLLASRHALPAFGEQLGHVHLCLVLVHSDPTPHMHIELTMGQLSKS